MPRFAECLLMVDPPLIEFPDSVIERVTGES